MDFFLSLRRSRRGRGSFFFFQYCCCKVFTAKSGTAIVGFSMHIHFKSIFQPICPEYKKKGGGERLWGWEDMTHLVNRAPDSHMEWKKIGTVKSQLNPSEILVKRHFLLLKSLHVELNPRWSENRMEMGIAFAGPILPGAAVVGWLPPHLSSNVPLREPTSTCICSLFKTASSFDLWHCANVISVIKGQYLLNQRITLWFPSKVQGSRGLWQPVQHRAKGACRESLS